MRHLTTTYAADARIVTPTGDTPARKRLWADLDDISLVVDDAEIYPSILSSLASAETRKALGLEPNVRKCSCTGTRELRDTGVPALGSWVAGLSSPWRPPRPLLTACAFLTLPLHHRITVLRLLFPKVPPNWECIHGQSDASANLVSRSA